MKDKRVIILTIIGVAILVLFVIGATYAYFSVPVKNNFTKTNISSTVESIGVVTMSPGSDISMEITSGQMMKMDTDVAYYGSSEGTTEEETSEIIGTASVSGNGVFNCTYDLVMNATGTNNMYDAVQGMTDKEGQLILTVNGVRYDFSTTNLFPKTISGEMLGLTEGVNQELTAQLKLVNSSGVEQNALVGTDINITFELKNFNCKIANMGSAGTYVMETSPANISTELVNGLYRFQGTKDEVTNNYLCFMTTNKVECGAGTIYRILGITPDGQLKIIENSGSSGTEKWHDNTTEDPSWPYSSLFNYLDTLSKTSISTKWQNTIVDKEWKYGNITEEEIDEMASSYSTLEEIYNGLFEKENAFKNKINAKVGLLSLRDIYSHSSSCYEEGDCPNGWLKLSSIDGATGTREWIMTKEDALNAYNFHPDGISGNTMNSTYAIRPVVYLKSDLTLSGTGTIDDPYMIAIN